MSGGEKTVAPRRDVVARNLINLAVVVLVAALAVQAAGASVGNAALQQQEPAPTAGSGADAIYVSENGDAVLVYEATPGANDVNRTEFGLSTAENLAYLRMSDPVEDSPEVRGAFVLEATRNALATRGNLSMPTPDAIRSFSVTATGSTTNESSQSDLSLSVTALDESGMSQAIKTANTSGSVTTTADSVRATGRLSVDSGIPVPASAHQSLDASLSTESGEYVLTVEQSTIRNPQRQQIPRDETAAREALQLQYGSLAAALDGSASVDLESYEATEVSGGVRVEQAYTVRLSGVDEGLQQSVRRELARSPEIPDEQADRLATALADVEIEDVSLQYSVDGDGATANLRVDVSNYGDLAMAYLEVISSMENTGVMASDLDRLQATLEAQRAADLEQTMTWSGTLSHPDSDSVHGEFEYHASASNWAAYVDELESRDVPSIETRYAIEGAVEDERLVFDGNASMVDARLYEELLRAVPVEDEASAETARVMTALRAAQPQRGKLVTRYDADGFHLEAGAAFDNLSALRDGISEEATLPPVTSVVGRMDDSGGSTYVTVEGAIDGAVSEAEVRSLSYVDDETTVYLPGEGQRDFPSMDVERAQNFLDFEVTTGASGPGFGPVAALLALLGATLWVARKD